MAFDTLSYARRLKQAGVPDTQAEAMADATRELLDSDLATKGDIAAVTTELMRLNNEMIAFKTDMTALKTDMTALKTDMTALKTDMTALKNEVVSNPRWRPWNNGL